MKTFLIKLIATGFGFGYSPVIPGTIGSLLGIAVFLILIQIGLSPLITTGIIIALFYLGIVTGTEAEKIFHRKDARAIVIDEIVGCLIFLYLVPLKIWYIILGFIIYRILDIIKPFPAHSLQKLRGGWGIMMDDVVAGIYTGAIIRISLWLKNYF